MHNANWYAVREFLNWLSAREGLEPCYVTERDAIGRSEFALRRDANGYRLPTEAEWEYACRAGTITDCSYGPRYGEALYSASSFIRVSRLPNAWGLFDMYSEAGEVVEDRFGQLPLNWGVTEPVVNPFSVALRPGILGVVVRGEGPGTSSRRRECGITEAKWPMSFRVARNAPHALLQVGEQAPAVACDTVSFARLAALSKDGCAPHLLEIARRQVADRDIAGAAISVENLLSQLPPWQDFESPRSQFLTRLADHQEVYGELVARRPDDTHLRICRGRYYALHKMWKEAATEFGAVMDSRDPRNSTWEARVSDQEKYEYAMLLLLASREPDFLAYRKRLMTEAEAYRDDVGPVWTVLKTTNLAPFPDAESMQQMQRWFDYIQAKGWIGQGSPPCGLAAFRLGRYDQMVSILGQHNDGARCGPALAMAKWRQGDQVGAREQLARHARRDIPAVEYGWPNYFYFIDECLSHNLLLTEAEREIFGPEESRLAEVAKQQAQDKGRDSREYWQAQYDLAQGIERQSFQREQARKLYEEIYKNQARILGADHLDTKATARRLADLIFDTDWVVLWTPHSDQEYAQAFSSIQRAQQLVPDDAKFAAPVAWGYYRTGKLDEAARQLDAVASRAGVWAGDAWFLHAMLAYERGDKEEANHWFRVASYALRGAQIGTQRVAMDSLGRYDSRPQTDALLFDAYGFLIRRYSNDYNLYMERGVAHVRARKLAEAHADFKKAFDLSPSLEAADWLAMTSLLTDQSTDRSAATARLVEHIRAGGTPDFSELLRRVQAYSIHADNQDYSGILEGIDATAGDNQDPSLLLTRSIVQFRMGQEAQFAPVRNDEDPQSTVLSMCFATLAQCRAGQHDAARQQLAEIQDYAGSLLASPDGPDFPASQRAHAWTVSQILLKEVTEAIPATPAATSEDKGQSE